MYSMPISRASESAESYKRHWRTSSSLLIVSDSELGQVLTAGGQKRQLADMAAVVVAFHAAAEVRSIGMKGVQGRTNVL